MTDRCTGKYTALNCRGCRKRFSYTGSIPVRMDLQYLYDFLGTSPLARELKHDWVGVLQNDDAFCRLCVRSRKIIFPESWAG